MKPKPKLGELALSLQEARRMNPAAYRIIHALSGITEKRIKEIAYGAEPDLSEKMTLERLARG
jgi:hypothetical protein